DTVTRASLPCMFRFSSFFILLRRPPSSPLFPYTTLFRSSWTMRPGAVPRSGAIVRAPSGTSACRRLLDGIGLEEKARNFARSMRSEEHTSELQSRGHLVCRLLLEKKKNRQRAVDIRQDPH